MTEMKDMDKNYYLAKWMNGEISDDALKSLVGKDQFDIYKRIKTRSAALKTPDFDANEVLNTINYRKNKTKKHYLPNFLKIAATVLLLISIYFIFNDKSTIYQTAIAEKSEFLLPDSSQVELNADSKISFSKSKWKNHRDLRLNGEGYFQVKKGSKFTVHTALGEVSVLGTKFNVFARNHYFYVTCYQGLVSVSYKNQTFKVPAGKAFKVELSNIQKPYAIVDKIPSWIANFSQFKSIPYYMVVKELERQYKIKIVYNKKYSNQLFTGNFTHKNLNLALKAITIPLNLTFKFETNQTVQLIKNDN
ncbi:MAG: FecR family protein [Lutibacter sp.]